MLEGRVRVSVCECVRVCVCPLLAQDAAAACGESMPLAHLNGTMCARQPPGTIEAPLRLAWDGRHSEPSQPRSTASASNFREAPITVPSSQRLTRRLTFTIVDFHFAPAPAPAESFQL